MQNQQSEVKTLLQNYLGDLEQNFSNGGIESVNCMSYGTPYFKNDSEFGAYCNRIEKAIAAL